MTAPRFSTLTFQREVAAPVTTLYHAWLAPAARALWSPPGPDVTIDFLETSTEVGGREVSLCKVDGFPDVRVEVRWLHLGQGQLTVNSEHVATTGKTDAAALVIAAFSGNEDRSRLDLTVQLAAMDEVTAAGYQQGYTAALANLGGVAERTMVLQRVIKAPVSVVWGAWLNPETLPQWWGPDGFSCRTTRIDLREGGDWVFDMIAPDGTVFPNHHRYRVLQPLRGIEYTLHWGENGPKHADAWVTFAGTDSGTDGAMQGTSTTVTLGMVMNTAAEFQQAKGFGAIDLGLQTLGKLARFVGAN